MIPLTLAQIAEITGGQLHGDPAAVVTGEVVIDSRRAGPGGLFAAVAGERADGHDFAPAAVAAGAVAVLATRPVPVPSVMVGDVPAALAALARFVVDALPAVAIAGITGSSGKTTTKDLAAQLIERLGPTIAPAGSFNNEFGHPLTVLRADAATRYLVLELSARGPGHIAYLCGIAPPRYGAVLNVGHAHAGEFGGLDQVARAKGELVEALPADGAAILNADDPRVLAMAARTAARVVTFGVAHDRRTRPADDPGGGRAAGRPRAAELHLADTRRPGHGHPPAARRAYRAGCPGRRGPRARARPGPGRHRGRAFRGGGAQPLADGGPPPGGWGDGHQRRVQREPRVRPGGRWTPSATWRRTDARSRSSATWPSWATSRGPATKTSASSPPGRAWPA